MKVFSKAKYNEWKKRNDIHSTWEDSIPDSAPVTFCKHSLYGDIYTVTDDNGSLFYLTSDWVEDVPDTVYIVLFNWQASDAYGVDVSVHATYKSALSAFNHLVEQQRAESWVKDAWTDGKLNDGYAAVDAKDYWSVYAPSGDFTCVNILCRDVQNEVEPCVK